MNKVKVKILYIILISLISIYVIYICLNIPTALTGETDVYLIIFNKLFYIIVFVLVVIFLTIFVVVVIEREKKRISEKNDGKVVKLKDVFREIKSCEFDMILFWIMIIGLFFTFMVFLFLLMIG